MSCLKNTHWVATDPARQPGRIVPGTVIVELALFVTLFAGEAIAFSRKAAKGCLAVGRVLLAAHPAAGGVDDDVAAAQVIADVVFHGRSYIAGERGTHSDHRQPF